MDCFDADVVIYAAVLDHPLGRRVRPLIDNAATATEPGAGSVILLPEVLSTPLRRGADDEVAVLAALLGRLDLYAVDRVLADMATTLGARYKLRASDAIHLATAATVGADRFITNNRRDFDRDIDEVDIVFPDALPDP